MNRSFAQKHAPQMKEDLEPLSHTAQNRCFGCGPVNPVGLHLDFFLAADLAVVCDVAVGDMYEGPRGYVHGGIIATLLDETMSKAVRAHNAVGVTRHMEVDYRKPVPSQDPVRLVGRVTQRDGRKIWAEASILDGQGTTLAQSKGLFIEIKARQEKLVLSGEPRPHG